MYDFTRTRVRIRMSIIFHAAFYKDPNWLSTHKILWPIHLVATTSGYSSSPIHQMKKLYSLLKEQRRIRYSLLRQIHVKTRALNLFSKTLAIASSFLFWKLERSSLGNEKFHSANQIWAIYQNLHWKLGQEAPSFGSI